MSAFISTIGIQTNSLTSELITVALLAINNNKVYFHFSENKLLVAEKISGIAIKKHILHSLKLIHEKTNEINKNINIKSELFVYDNVFNSAYIEYLHKYSKGLIQFDKPKPIATEINQDTFNCLYESFIGEPYTVNKDKIKNPFHKTINKILNNPQLKQKADINYALKPSVVKGILNDTQISLITQNGSLTALQVVDFSITTVPNIVSKLNEFEITVNALKKIPKGAKGTYKIIVEEPELKTPQHIIFDNVIKYKKEIYTTADTENLNQTISEIIDKPYLKFSESYS